MNAGIDIEFNFYTDTLAGRDPDSHSPMLRRCHKVLWSKPLPNGYHFQLEDTHPKAYLYHCSELGEFFLSSDAITHSYRETKELASVLEEVPRAEVDKLFDCGSTIGAYTLFPGNKVDRKMTINGARGCNSRIRDRFDLTLECIRLFYDDQESPLYEVFDRYQDFFALFSSFKGYVDFFMLQDLVTDDYSGIRYHIPHLGFDSDPLPSSKAEYLQYKYNTIRFGLFIINGGHRHSLN